ncbi:hypothetical protein C8R44DRAFT_53944 [Mycena epipterygia]|nr:hypothetical protein C8R44DRAFT_53944 [Mycena epipterygia]
MPAIQSTQGQGISIAGHTYSSSQVHEFFRGSAILGAFLVFSYLALVTFPRLAAQAGDRKSNQNIVPVQRDISVPERPFAPRPAVGSSLAQLPKARTTAPTADVRRHRGCAWNRSPLAPIPSPTPSRSSAVGTPHAQQTRRRHGPALSLATKHLHRIADAVVGAHPAALPLAARVSPVNRQTTFPWVSDAGGYKFSLVHAGVHRRRSAPAPVSFKPALLRVSHSSAPRTSNSPLRLHNPQLRVHNSQLRVHNSQLRVHNSQLRVHNPQRIRSKADPAVPKNSTPLCAAAGKENERRAVA